jgi:phosphate transport system permease protein
MIRRRWTNRLMLGLLGLLALGAAVPFYFISWYVLKKGAGALDWAFFTELPKGPGDLGGGMANAMLGSLTLMFLASLIGIPWGLASGIYLAEYGRGRTAQGLRFAIDLLASTPSIVVGIFVYGLLVVRFGFSAYAGALALAIIMLPVIARSAEEILKLVPGHLREAGLALGVPRWKVILRIVIPGSLSGLLTGVMLAIARAMGETAPLLFTSLGNQYYAHGLGQPTASLPVQIYNFAKSGYPDLERQAWAGALVLVFFVFVLNLATRLMVRPNRGV